MKKVLVLLFLCNIHFVAFPQKQFEGEIVYQVKTDDGKEAGKLHLLLGKNAFRITANKKNSTEIETEKVIVRLDSGKVYTLNTTNSSFQEKELTKAIDFEQPSRKTIAGYTTTPVAIVVGLYDQLLSHSATRSQVVMYVADSLFYKIPSPYTENEEFIFFHDGKIVISSVVKSVPKKIVWDKRLGDRRKGATTEVSIEAIEVKTMQIDEKEFLIPAGYSSETFYPATDSLVVVDSIGMVEDSIVKAQPPKISKKPTKRTGTPIKKSTKSPARKQE